MLQFRCAKIHEPRYGSSRDLEVKATAECPAVTCRLKVGFSAPSMWTLGYGNNPRSALFILLTISCIDSVIQFSYYICRGQLETYLEHSICSLPVHFHLSMNVQQRAMKNRTGRVYPPSITTLVFRTRPYTTSRV